MKNPAHKSLTGGRLGLFCIFALVGACAAGSPHAVAASSAWTPIYQDRYDYSAQSPKGATFNTWFWREDSAATHEFEDVSSSGCGVKKPCVKLVAQAYTANADYTNAEMYNNSCVMDADGGEAAQQLATLQQSVWGMPLFERIKSICYVPYPYQGKDSYLTPYGLTSSWSRGAPSYLDANPLAFTSYDIEADWKAVRDITFNNPYRADTSTALRIGAEILAATSGQGGSRGWGFWNTSLDPGFLQLAWFMEYSVPEAYLASIGQAGRPNRAVVMQTIGRTPDGKSLKICSTTLSPKTYDIYRWRGYAIEWRPDAVRYFVDGQLVADHRNIRLERHMAFHNWVDNRNYTAPQAGFANFPLTEDKANFIRDFLVETAPVATLPPLPGKGSGQCAVLSAKGLLMDILKALAKEYF